MSGRGPPVAVDPSDPAAAKPVPGGAPGHAAAAGARRMQLRYGFNEINGWWHMSLGDYAGEIRRRLRLMETRVIRIFVFDQPVPSPIRDWHLFAAHVQAILDAGAVPMITFAKFAPPYDRSFNIRRFVERCREVVWSCCETWGGAAAGEWYWCVWNEPNNPSVGGNLSFEQYRAVYAEVAAAVFDQIGPHLGGRTARIGGPSIDGTHRAYWMDWIARLLTEIDSRHVGFVNWHLYGDWRPAVPSAPLGLEMWGARDAPPGDAFEALLMAQTPAYEARARGVARLLRGRDVLNVCGELNTIAHHENYYTLGLNQNRFGAAYYVSALIHLVRGGAELEMRWTATGHDDAYGLISMHGEPTTAGFAKQLFAQHVRHGDLVRFPAHRLEAPEIDAIVAAGAGGRLSGVFVNTAERVAELPATAWDRALDACDAVLRLDAGTGGRIVRAGFDGTVRIEGRGIAVVTNAAAETVID